MLTVAGNSSELINQSINQSIFRVA